jgi:hypothetical protein
VLLNEFLKEHRKVEQLEQQVERLTAGLQKVSAQLEASRPAAQVVNNPWSRAGPNKTRQHFTISRLEQSWKKRKTKP